MSAAAGNGAGDGTATPRGAAVCVLGMSRSGTSLTARLLALAGVHLGDEEDLLGGELAQIPTEDRERAGAANPEGFWEHYRLMRLNERILRRFGGSWREPPPLPPGWQDSAELADEREQARTLLEESFAGRDLWGWKDPRNALTLPFWHRLLPDLRHVVCLRNPLDVAASLQRRDGMPVEQGLELWGAYVVAALLNTAGRSRLLVSYESYFDDAEEVAARLARYAGRETALEPDEARRVLREAVDERLWRNRTPAPALTEDERVPAEIADLYLLAERAARTAPEPLDAPSRDIHIKLDRAALDLRGLR